MVESIEIWSDVLGYEGYYQVSDKGRVKSVSRQINRIDGFVQNIKERVLSERIDTNGYKIVNLCMNRICKNFKIHILVANHFIGIRSSGLVVNHKDGNKTNNDISNLEIITQSDNIKHAFANGLKENKKGEFYYKSKLKNSQVREIREKHLSGLKCSELARIYGVSDALISSILLNKTYKNV